jgi:hypothetical protein
MYSERVNPNFGVSINRAGATAHDSQGEPRRMVSEFRHYTKLWLELAAANGMTLASFMTTRKDSLHGDAMALQRWAAGE